MPSGCSSDQPRVMVGLSGWSTFSGVWLFLNPMLDVGVHIIDRDSAHRKEPAPRRPMPLLAQLRLAACRKEVGLFSGAQVRA